MADEEVRTCQDCGASVYPEHIQSGKAGLWAGKLLCAMCFKEHQPPSPPLAMEEPSLEPVAMVDEAEATPASAPKIQSFGGSQLGKSSRQSAQDNFRRPLLTDAPCATRCRTFHSKLNDGALDFLTNQINEWCDANEDITIKFCTSTIGIFEGKHADPHLILTVFY